MRGQMQDFEPSYSEQSQALTLYFKLATWIAYNYNSINQLQAIGSK
jgi:hypothetical protein